jgi:catechol 2,3-dioxygenase-like lactoylglutathione lyase family enzyme
MAGAAMMRTALVLVTGMLIGAAMQPGFAQQARIVGLNHVAVSVADYKAAVDFYSRQMGFRPAFSFQEPDGSPYLTYLQINRNTFVEVMQATPDRPVGCPHFGLEVEQLDSAVEQLRQRQHRAAGVRIAIAPPKSHRCVEVEGETVSSFVARAGAAIHARSRRGRST